MNKLIYIDGNDLYLSKKYLKDFTSLKNIERWIAEKSFIKTKVESELFFLYKSIPFRTKRKLPTADKIISQERSKSEQTKAYDILHEAFYFKHAAYKSFYEKEARFTTSQVTKFCQLHSVFQAIIDLKNKEAFRHLELLHEAFNDLFPGKFKTKNAFSNAILKAMVEGITSVAIDKRTFGNNDRGKKEFTPQIDYVISALVSSNGKLTNAVMLEKANNYFKENGLSEFSLSWMKKQRREWLSNIEVYKARYGAIEAQKQMPFASLKNAEQVHWQWQVDGWNLPFWEDKFHRSVLVFVIDNCSKKILGYAIGKSENSDVIKAALRNAVYNTGVLPFELVMDNHSFTKTQAAFNFEDLLIKVGGKLTKTSNPRQKIIVERYIQNIDGLMKQYPYWLGKSIRSKSIEDIISKEDAAEAAQKFKSNNEVISITSKVIEDYNNKPQKGISPSQKYIDNPHPNPILLSQHQKALLLPCQITKQIRNGQITIMRGIEKFEYQLPHHLHQTWNNKVVVVTHDVLQEGIYLYNKDNGEGIVFLKQKYKINNAQPLQTATDIHELNKHSGRIKGIETKARKQLSAIRDKALNIDPNAAERISEMVTPKNILKDLKQDGTARMMAEKNGVNINELTAVEPRNDLPLSLKPHKKVSNPFTVTNNKIEVIDPLKDFSNDWE